MTEYEKLIEQANHAAAYPDVEPISYRLVEKLVAALEATIAERDKARRGADLLEQMRRSIAKRGAR